MDIRLDLDQVRVMDKAASMALDAVLVISLLACFALLADLLFDMLS